MHEGVDGLLGVALTSPQLLQADNSRPVVFFEIDCQKKETSIVLYPYRQGIFTNCTCVRIMNEENGGVRLPMLLCRVL
jgi:hypothetical protein